VKAPWSSHAFLAELLRRAAGYDIAKRSIAGLISISLDWCWPQFLSIDHPEKPWALMVLAAAIVDGDDHPRELDDYRAKTEDLPTDS
jgi:hypothetical protein